MVRACIPGINQEQHTTALASRYAARCDAFIQIDDHFFLFFFVFFICFSFIGWWGERQGIVQI
jgi:hypothetical protein